MIDKLKTLIEKCANSVSVEVNQHRDFHQSVEEYFKDNSIMEDYLEDIDVEVYKKMIELDTIVEIQFYPTNSVGFFKVFHYDLETALDIALETF